MAEAARIREVQSEIQPGSIEDLERLFDLESPDKLLHAAELKDFLEANKVTETLANGLIVATRSAGDEPKHYYSLMRSARSSVRYRDYFDGGFEEPVQGSVTAPSTQEVWFSRQHEEEGLFDYGYILKLPIMDAATNDFRLNREGDVGFIYHNARVERQEYSSKHDNVYVDSSELLHIVCAVSRQLIEVQHKNQKQEVVAEEVGAKAIDAIRPLTK